MDSTSKRRSSFKDVVYSDGTQGILRTDSHPKVPLLDIQDEVPSNYESKSSDKCSCYQTVLDSRFDLLCDNDFYQVRKIFFLYVFYKSFVYAM